MTFPLHPFEATEEQLYSNIEYYVDKFVGSLQSFYMVMPEGSAFVDFKMFKAAYDALSNGTNDFEDFSAERALSVVRQSPLVLIVMRAMLGLSPPEFAHITTITTGVEVNQSAARRLDKRAREGKSLLSGVRPGTQRQVKALVETAVQLILQGAPHGMKEGVIHRLDKIDTRDGLPGLRELIKKGVPYETLLYERYLGRPFATHRDAVSERVGDILEDTISEILASRGISFYKASTAERFEGMDQAPDFFVPDQFNPAVIVEAKLAEDDGTARDKVTRVQHLAELRDQQLRRDQSSFEVLACVDGRGFGIRREDVKKLLLATKGKLFNLQTVGSIVDCTSLRNFI